jgi:hypothetical protein
LYHTTLNDLPNLDDYLYTNIILLFVSALDFRWRNSEEPRCSDPAFALPRNHNQSLKAPPAERWMPGSFLSIRGMLQFDRGQAEILREFKVGSTRATNVSVEPEYELAQEKKARDT